MRRFCSFLMLIMLISATLHGATPFDEKVQVNFSASVTSGRVSTGGLNLNVRSGPWGTIVGSLKNGAAVKIVGSGGDWYKISYGGKTRYVHKNYISTSAKKASQAAAVKSFKAYVNTGGLSLNVRSGPWGSIVGSLANGKSVTVVGSSGDWYKISYGGKTRYVYKKYISKSSGSSSGSASSSNTYKASVVGQTRGDGTAAGALTWARDQINGRKNGYNPNNGKTSKDPKAWTGWCLAFVNSAYGRKKPLLMAYSAIQSYYKCKAAGKIKTSRNPPPGAAMFTSTVPGNPYGHVFIATGKMAGPNDPIIITNTGYGIKEMPMSRMGGGAYLGWTMP